MPIEVMVGPSVLTINQGSTFMVTERTGAIAAQSEQGVFAGDTRFVSAYKVSLNGQPWELLTAAAVNYYAACLHLANREVAKPASRVRRALRTLAARFHLARGGAAATATIAPHELGLKITRTVGDGIHEDLDITNYSIKPVRFQLEIALQSDFADVFEVKSHDLVHRGGITSIWDEATTTLTNTYVKQDFRRALNYRLANSSSVPRFGHGRVAFSVVLAPGASWHTCAFYILDEGGRLREPLYPCNAVGGADTVFDRLQQDWRDVATTITSSNEEVYRSFQQSIEDMGAMRIYDEDFAPDVWLPAAGVPWFMTVFGRDSLLVSLQNMIAHAPFALGALKKLAQYQATTSDDFRDADPGKIMHELRTGELAHFHKVPHTPYYGTWDASPLYLIVLHEAWKWLGDITLLREYRDTALRCLEWIDQYGDLDGDGFQEYQTRSSLGYENVNWKDSGDAVVYPDGTQVKQPKAMCELQGYVYDAKLRMAEVFTALGEPERAAALRQQATKLKSAFDAAFWCEDLGFYAYGLDAAKRQIKTIASNQGHLLWSGIVPPERAVQVVRRFFEEDMESGWGIRTLSARNPAYNPFSYQLGSVWPHDNGIIAAGMKRYGFAAEANQVARDIFGAAAYFEGHRLPELYAGLQRQPGTFPVQYLGANTPQAWAAGSIFQLVQTVLGLRADAPAGRLYVDPALPSWLPELCLNGLQVGQTRLNLHFWRDGDASCWEVLKQTGQIAVVAQPWQPWSASFEHVEGRP